MSDSSPGQIIGGIVGATIGFFTGGPAGALKGFSIGYTIGGAVDPPTPDLGTAVGPRLNDLKVQSSNYGAALPIVYGRARIAGNVIWIKNNKLIEKRTVTEQDAGGKGGGGGGGEVITYQYYATFAVSVCEGPVTGIRKIWADNVCIFDGSDTATPAGVIASQSAASAIEVYTGTATQEPNALIEADQGTAPAFRGTCYVVFNELALEKFGNRIPNMSFEVVDGASAMTLIQNDSVTYAVFSGKTCYGQMCDANGRSIGFQFYQGSGDPQRVRPTIIYPDGRQTFGEIFDTDADTISKNYEPFTQGTYGRQESDDPIWCAVGSADAREIYVYRYSIADDAHELISNYTISSALTALSGDAAFTQRGGYITFFNPIDDYLYRAPYDSNGALDIVATPADVSGTITCHTHDGSTLYVLTSSPANIYTFSLATGAAITSAALDRNYQEVKYNPVNGKLYAVTPAVGDFYEIDPTSFAQSLILSGIVLNWFAGWGVRGDLLVMISTGGNMDWYRLDALSSSTVTLPSILSDLSTRSGLVAGDIDTSGVSDTVAGFVHSKVASAAADMRTLALSYHFDSIESGYKIKWVSRGGASVAALTADDLAAHEYGQDRPEELVAVRERAIRIPQRVDVSFIDINREFDPGEQYAERIVTDAKGVRREELAVLLSSDQAAKIADIRLWEAWLARNLFEFSLPYKWSALEPADLVTLTYQDQTYTLRIVEVSIGAPGIVDVRAVQDIPEIYTSTAVGGVVTDYTAGPTLVGETALKFMDIPILRDVDDDAGYYYGGGPTYGTQWDGAVVFQSNDSGESYYRISALTEQLITGKTTTTLADNITTSWDRESTVNVVLDDGDQSLSSASEINVLNGSNLCAIGANGRWEICKFANATLEADGSYTLDTFIRGYRGTEWATTLHTSADTFVLLQESTLLRFDGGASVIGLQRYYKGVTFGQTLYAADSTTFTNNAVGLKPYAPVHIKGTRDGSGNLTITWIRRTRVSGEWRDYVDVLLGEDSESYEVDIISQGSPDEVLRTISVSSETASYTAAQQTTDFGAAQDSVLVRVYQVSDTVGRGYKGEATV